MEQPTLYLQPIIELESSEVVGYEMLSRWEGQETEDIFAQARLNHTLPELCSDIITAGLSIVPRLPKGTFLSINTTVELLASLDPDDNILMHMSARDRARLVLEVTEHTPGEIETVYELLNSYRQKGIRCAIDDVGSKYGNLYRIVQTLPDFLKIDASYIRHCDLSPVNRAAIRSIVTLGREIHAKVIAEGIETVSEAAWCERLGVGYGQGYLFARPKPAEEYLAPLKEVDTASDDLAIEIVKGERNGNNTGSVH